MATGGVDQRSVYIARCRELGISANSALLKTFPSAGDPAPSCDAYDLHRNLLGDKGVVALVEALKLNPHFTRLNLSDNGIRNAGITALVNILKTHPRLTSLDISNNQISHTGADALLLLIKSNPNLTLVNYSHNRINAATRLKLKIALDENRAGRAK
eukprot:TRINITY_DN14288_c0_g1_i1.p1 TRINITY_DN14288_c0_g1~~TRINITY_DN14288_c0_g1_i1.p1  ORF type:complete len:157 (+),score=21.66 TRINITY_DN14288_c0_g1_i1:41-511(+)